MGPSGRTIRNLTLQSLSNPSLLAMLVTSSTKFLLGITDPSSLEPDYTYAQPSGISASRTRLLLSRKTKLVSSASIGQGVTVETTAQLFIRAGFTQTAPCLPMGWNVGRNTTDFCTAQHHSSVTWWCATEPCHLASFPTSQLPLRRTLRLLMKHRMPSYPSSKSQWRDPESCAMCSLTPDQILTWFDMPMPKNWGYLGQDWIDSGILHPHCRPPPEFKAAFFISMAFLV